MSDPWTPMPTEMFAKLLYDTSAGCSQPLAVAEYRELLKELVAVTAERDRLRERVQATADVGCVNSPAGRRWPMKCLPRDKCSFCRAADLLESL